VDEAIDYIAKQIINAKSKPFFIGLAGESGAGKTYFSKRLQHKVLQIDEYYFDRAPMELWDSPEGIELDLLRKHMLELKKGNAVQKPIYKHETARRIGSEEFKPHEIIIVEGLYALNEKLKDLYDLRVYIESEPDTTLERKTIRDMTERGRTREFVRKQFDEIVKPMANIHVVPTRKHADIIVVNK